MKTKTYLLSIIILAAVLVVAGCSSSNDTTTVATTASTTNADSTTTVSGTATTTTGALSFNCADLISAEKFSEILGGSGGRYIRATPNRGVCSFLFNSAAYGYGIFESSLYTNTKNTIDTQEHVTNYLETNRAGKASFQYNLYDSPVVTVLSTDDKYTILVNMISTVDQGYLIAAEIDKNTDKITQT
ncbi:MAG: DUF3558 family protein [Candidatus Aenigmatarchaeota archaeon]